MKPCHVCGFGILPDPVKGIRYEGTVWRDTLAWTFGPVPVHDDCRTELVTPHDGDPDHTPRWQWVKP